MGRGEVMEGFVEEVSFELGFHRQLRLGGLQKLGWEKTFWAEQQGEPGWVCLVGREACNEFHK